MMVLVDTSVWIDFFAARNEAHVAALEELISRSEDVCTCGIILVEVLQGIRHNREYRKTRELFDCLIYLPMEHGTYLSAAELYRNLRRRGKTIRRAADCMIAAVALQYEVPLLHNDRDFVVLEEHAALRRYS